jgi:hypothetical protein
MRTLPDSSSLWTLKMADDLSEYIGPYAWAFRRIVAEVFVIKGEETICLLRREPGMARKNKCDTVGGCYAGKGEGQRNPRAA